SEWLYNAVQAFDVLTIHPDYFRLRKPIARRVYELARKHCGRQAKWTIGLPLLLDKSGSRGSIYEFHEALKKLAEANILPEYRIVISSERAIADVKVTFYIRDAMRLLESFA
ncbi:replication initiator protein A, partial [Pseudomonas sp. FSL A6-1183]